jgi:SAM-dependent methyltransferase
MIQILNSWNEIGEAYNNLINLHMPIHKTPMKNWDIWQIYNIVKDMDKDTYIFDFGCRESAVINLCYKMGFRNLYGIDLYELDSKYNRRSYLNDLYLWFGRKLIYGTTYHLQRGDGLVSKCSSDFYDIITSVSVVEHGVDIEVFFKEMYRLLKKYGLLYVSTDYWPEKIKVHQEDWVIFSKEEIEDIIKIAWDNGFNLLGEKNMEQSPMKTISFNGYDFTFLSMIFKKSES